MLGIKRRRSESDLGALTNQNAKSFKRADVTGEKTKQEETSEVLKLQAKVTCIPFLHEELNKYWY